MEPTRPQKSNRNTLSRLQDVFLLFFAFPFWFDFLRAKTEIVRINKTLRLKNLKT